MRRGKPLVFLSLLGELAGATVISGRSAEGEAVSVRLVPPTGRVGERAARSGCWVDMGYYKSKMTIQYERTNDYFFFLPTLYPQTSPIREPSCPGQLTEGVAILYEIGCRMLGATTF